MYIRKMYSVYCLNFNAARRRSMEDRFRAVNVECTMSPGVALTDARITSECPSTRRCHSCMLGHLDMIRDFLETSAAPYGVFCEDDILIDSEFDRRIQWIIRDFETQNLDVLLLGYLARADIKHCTSYKGFRASMQSTHDAVTFRYFNYVPHSIWGTQMYMLSRPHARALLDKYGGGPEGITNVPFSADWTITQEGNHRIVYPMLAIEDGTTHYVDAGQASLHRASHEDHVDSSVYI